MTLWLPAIDPARPRVLLRLDAGLTRSQSAAVRALLLDGPR